MSFVLLTLLSCRLRAISHESSSDGDSNVSHEDDDDNSEQDQELMKKTESSSIREDAMPAPFSVEENLPPLPDINNGETLDFPPSPDRVVRVVNDLEIESMQLHTLAPVNVNQSESFESKERPYVEKVDVFYRPGQNMDKCFVANSAKRVSSSIRFCNL
jgi:hypothetical protein